MDLKELLRNYKEGRVSEEDVLSQLRMNHIESLESRFKFDLSRGDRTGFPEAVLALNKSPDDIARILKSILRQKDRIFVTKLDAGTMSKVKSMLESENVLGGYEFEYHETPQLLVVRRKGAGTPNMGCSVGVIAGGTSDIPIAEEARIILQESGINTIAAYDVGVAGLHRLFNPLRKMVDKDVDILIVVAGMEGALPSVVKGLIDVPVIGVPSSVGYGYRTGESALIAMLNSCVPGLLVTNIDNGFGAAAAAYIICSRISKCRK